MVELPETDEELLQLVGSISTDPATDQEQQQEEKLVNVDTSTKRGLQLVNELQLYLKCQDIDDADYYGSKVVELRRALLSSRLRNTTQITLDSYVAQNTS